MFSGEAEHIQHYIETNTGGMTIADIATTISPKLLSARSLAHRLVSIPQGRYIILMTTLQRASQIKGLPNFRKSREYLQVLRKYLQVPAGSYKRTPAGAIHQYNQVSQHIGSINFNGYRQYRIKGATSSDDKVAERHTISTLRRIGGETVIGALHAETSTSPPAAESSHPHTGPHLKSHTAPTNRGALDSLTCKDMHTTKFGAPALVTHGDAIPPQTRISTSSHN
jgi:hypothetical protein